MPYIPELAHIKRQLNEVPQLISKLGEQLELDLNISINPPAPKQSNSSNSHAVAITATI
jgi:hypothetical protein